MPKLTLAKTGAELEFQQTVVIGRSGAVDLAIADPSVSRRHARLTVAESGCSIEDLGSANGTLVNGKKIAAVTDLQTGDQVCIGFIVTTFADGKTAARKPAASDMRIVDSGHASTVVMKIPASGLTAGQSGDAGAAFTLPNLLRFLDDFSKISDLVFDEPALVSFVVDELFELMPRADRVFVMLWDEAASDLKPSAARTRAGRQTEIVVSRTLLKDVMTTREAVISVDVQGDQRYASQASVHALGLRAVICVPILFQKQLYGVIQVDSASGSTMFEKADLGLALSLASQVGLALGYARLHAAAVQRELQEHDMALARKLQQHFLPSEPLALPGYSSVFHYRPALAVGGDFYDFLDLGSGLVGIIVGDVSGKGVSAALYAAKLTSDLRYQTAGQTEPSAILERTNRALSGGGQEGMFVTAAVAVLDPAKRRVTVASAGHPLPLVRDGNGDVTSLGNVGDPPLGLDPTATFTQTPYDLDAKDTVVMFTDGVVEAMNEREDLFGDHRLVDSLKASDGTVQGVLDRVVEDVRVFVGGASQSDDVTVVCFRCDRERRTRTR